MTIGILTKLTLQQPLKIIIPTAYITGFIVRVLELLLVYSSVLDLNSFALASDLVEGGSAIWALVGELGGLGDALEAEDVVAGEFALLFLVFLIEISQADRTVLGLAAILFTLDLDPVSHINHFS